MSNPQLNAVLRQLPAVTAILQSEKGKTLVNRFGHELVAEACDIVLGLWRRKILDNPAGFSGGELSSPEEIIDEIGDYLVSLTMPHLRRVINATGIILHTNLGRAVLCKRAQEALQETAAYYTNLEYNLQEGKRGTRYEHVEKLLVRLTGAESALVVNNNAAAFLLAVNTLAAGKKAIVSRGELIEIGGSFRIPEVLKMGGVLLAEVGTTNRTHLTDYQKAIDQETGVILKIHTSNYRITGFTKSVSREELVGLARDSGLPLLEDLGSGTIFDLSPYGLQGETPVYQTIVQGVDVVMFSGDKLLGGPQAGIIAGKKEFIQAMKANQLNRALRIDKFTLAALEATLREYLNPQQALKSIPLYRMLTIPVQELQERAERMVALLSLMQERMDAEVIPTRAQMGGGSLPGQEIPSRGLALRIRSKTAEEIDHFFRMLRVPIIGYIERDQFILDLRTLQPGDEEIIIRSINIILS